jgi:quinol monooxygenase YgiN
VRDFARAGEISPGRATATGHIDPFRALSTPTWQRANPAKPDRGVAPARIEQYEKAVIVGTVRILPAPARHADVLQVFRAIQGPVLTQPGCLGCHIYEEQGPDEAVVLVERWESEAALEAHLRSEAYRRILGAIELSSAPPEVRFEYVSATAGMELIDQSRNPAEAPATKESRP